MLKKLLVALVASAFALGAYAQAPKDEPKGQTEMKAEKKSKSAKKAKSSKKSSKSAAKAKSEDAKK